MPTTEMLPTAGTHPVGTLYDFSRRWSSKRCASQSSPSKVAQPS